MIEKFKGSALFITDSDGNLINNIDTDQIYHNSHLAITDISRMGQYAFGNLKGWENFPEMVQPGDIVITGENFGSGSSRQQAVDCFRSLGITAIIAKSFGSIYKRNAVNSGFLVLVSKDIERILEKKEDHIETKRIIDVDPENGIIKDHASDKTLGSVEALSTVEKEIYKAGDIFKYGKKLTG